MRVGYLGPAGTVSHEALMSAPGADGFELVPLPTLHAAVLAVHDGDVDRALVPIENSLEGAVNPTLDALAFETEDVAIVGELLHPVHLCLFAAAPLALDEVRTVVSHPQATGQCARFLRGCCRARRCSRRRRPPTRCARSRTGSSPPRRRSARASPAALYGAVVLLEDVEDDPSNETRFVWIAPRRHRAGPARRPLQDRAGVLGRRIVRPGVARALPGGVRLA